MQTIQRGTSLPNPQLLELDLQIYVYIYINYIYTLYIITIACKCSRIGLSTRQRVCTENINHPFSAFSLKGLDGAKPAIQIFGKQLSAQNWHCQLLRLLHTTCNQKIAFCLLPCVVVAPTYSNKKSNDQHNHWH